MQNTTDYGFIENATPQQQELFNKVVGVFVDADIPPHAGCEIMGTIIAGLLAHNASSEQDIERMSRLFFKTIKNTALENYRRIVKWNQQQAAVSQKH